VTHSPAGKSGASALKAMNGNATLAGEKLNISTRTIRNKLKRYAGRR